VNSVKPRLFALIAALMLTAMSVQSAAGVTRPLNDSRFKATPLIVGAPIDFNGTNATTGPRDPTDCKGSHGPFPGPYYGSVWFSYTATREDRWLFLSAPTVQGHPDDFLAITFVYAKTPHGLSLVDCTAFGNDAKWQPRAGTHYLIMEAGLSSAVTNFPPLSNRGGHGSIYLFHSKTNVERYHYANIFSYNDCGPTVNVSGDNTGVFELRFQKLGWPPFLSDDYEYHLVSTNPANGKWFREDGFALYRDMRITHVKGTIFKFVSKETGRPYTLTDMHGNRVFADFGTLVTTFRVDTKGDDALWNDQFIEGSFKLVRETGKHPAFHFQGDFCDIIRDLLGDGPGVQAGPQSRNDLAPLRRTLPRRPSYP
jgi:hypothetical protein